mmetsp:Transcript_46199/g.133089  ORF Transcript_46199/g.133089 Transcript_46199/m.133089 type:complete len:233 (-) Transcript_46199:398-1096(-)
MPSTIFSTRPKHHAFEELLQTSTASPFANAPLLPCPATFLMCWWPIGMSFWARFPLSTGSLKLTSTMPSSLTDSTWPGHQAWCELLHTSTASPGEKCPSPFPAPRMRAASASLAASDDKPPPFVAVSVFRRSAGRKTRARSSATLAGACANATPTKPWTAAPAPLKPKARASGAAAAPSMAPLQPFCNIAPTPAKLVIHVGMRPTFSLTQSSSEKWQQFRRNRSYSEPGHSL